MAGVYDIYVFEEERAFYTRPPVVMVSKSLSREVKIRNLTTHPISVKFHGGLISRPTITHLPDGIDVVHVEPEKWAAVPLSPGAGGIHDFEVDVEVSAGVNVRAPGNSWPKIIVDP